MANNQSQKKALNFEDPRYVEWIDRFVTLYKLPNEASVAEKLGLQPSGYSHYKRTNKFPYERLIEQVLEDGYSLDEIFYGKGFEKNTPSVSTKVLSKAPIPILNQSDKVLSVSALIAEQNENNSIKAIIQNRRIYIIDTSLKEIENEENYVIELNGIYYARKIHFVSDSIISLRLCFNEEEEVVQLSYDEFAKYIIHGRVIKSLDITVNFK